MENKLKSGGEIMEEFFSQIETLEGVELKIATSLKELYEKGKLSEKSIINSLLEIRKENA
ncbi:MAG: hypothetical protein H0U27_06135 [Nitrosopumilus sp.]|nr:hypothetical protein [Nitrosopumilus sp.]